MSRYKGIRNHVTSLQGINAELEKIAETQEDHLSRKGDSPNHMETDLDMNGQRVYNLPEPQSNHEPLTFGSGKSILDEATAQANKAEEEADRAEQEANSAAQSAQSASEDAEILNANLDNKREEFDSVISKAESDLQDAITRTGYNFIGEFTDGGTLENRIDVLQFDGEWYRWDGSLPKTVPAGSTPQDEGGVGSGAWLSVGDATLRSSLASQALGKGASLVSRSQVNVYSISELEELDPSNLGTANLDLDYRGGVFVFRNENLSDLVSSDPLQGLCVAPSFDSTGASGAWVRQFGQAVQVDIGFYIGWFGGGPGTSDNGPSTQAAYDLARAVGVSRVDFGVGELDFSTTVLLDKGSCAFVGSQNGFRQSGSAQRPTTYLRWVGSAEPMFKQNTSGMRFKGFGVGNAGSGVDWLELDPGSINNIYDELYFLPDVNGTPFSRSIIRSNGNRVGYSQFIEIRATSPAPVFLDIDGQDTPNAITPISFKNRCQFFAAGNDFTVVKIADETVETITFSECTLVGQPTGILTLIDTSEDPLPISINNLAINSCEFEQNSLDIDKKMFYLSNVANFAFNDNDINGSGATNQTLGELVGSNITSMSGNQYRRMDRCLFELDATSTYRIGINKRNTSNTGPEVIGGAGFTQLNYQPVMIVAGQDSGQASHGIYRVDIDNNSGYQFRCGVARPSYTLAGQVFTVVIRNVSSSGIATPVFTNFFKTAGGFTPPEPGFNRSVTFYFDGENAIEIGRSEYDVPNH